MTTAAGDDAVADACAAVRALVEAAVRGTARVGSAVSLGPPPAAGRLDVVLYQVTTAVTSLAKAGTSGAPPTLDLHLVVAAHAEDGGRAERLLGAAVRALHASPVLAGTGTRVVAHALPLAELAALWHALGAPLRPSACYVVGPVPLGDAPA